MNPTTLNTIVGIIGIVSTIIGIIVGIVGGKSLYEATKINNKAKADNGATVQQAQIINNGLDSYAVIRLSRETTQAELQKVIDELKPLTWEEIDDVVSEKITPTFQRLNDLQETVQKIPQIHVSKETPEEAKDGDIWLKIE